MLVEPMLQGAGGMIMWPAEFLAGVRRLCDRYGVLMIADEVLTGFGRTGRMFACEHGPVTPDIICLSKALTAGYLPLAVTAVTDAVLRGVPQRRSQQDVLPRPLVHGQSAGVRRGDRQLRSVPGAGPARPYRAARGAASRRADAAAAALPIVGDVRVLGGVGAVELVTDKATKDAGGYLDQIGPRLSSAFLERGLLLRPLGNVALFHAAVRHHGRRGGLGNRPDW